MIKRRKKKRQPPRKKQKLKEVLNLLELKLTLQREMFKSLESKPKHSKKPQLNFKRKKPKMRKILRNLKPLIRKK